MTPVTFFLRMNLRVTIHFTGGSLKNSGLNSLGQTQHVNGTHDTGLDCFYGIILVVNRRSRAGQIVNLIDLDVEREGHVMADDLEPGVADETINIDFRTRVVVVDAQDVATIR